LDDAIAVTVARQAVIDAGASLAPSSGRTGIYWETGMGAAGTVDECCHPVFQDDNCRLKPTLVVTSMNHVSAALISLEFGVTGPLAAIRNPALPPPATTIEGRSMCDQRRG
jgi:3-oxoacyl-(acyl-carrier-protein) synthase